MMPEQSIAHYKVISKLGEGGMGAVYRATDTKLNREVAVKILPDSFAGDPGRLARFTREAQVLASLNHPNIAQIYVVEDRALVMELVEGAELKGPLPVDTAVACAKQLAAALEAAHEKGIVDRDLKPANIKITPEGVLKVLDFGLAKAAEESPATSSASPTISPTFSLSMTQAGMILGTAAYMSPEQARGKAVDKRADIWAFGVVLYEMLSGVMLFRGETASDSMIAVATREPDWNALPAGTPAHLRKLLARCLEKDPRLRLRDIGEARIALEDPSADQVSQPLDAPARPASSRWPWLTAGLAAGLAIASAAWRMLAPRPEYHPLMRLRVDMGAAASSEWTDSIAISPDGTRVAYPVWTEGRALAAIRSVNDPNPTILAGTEGMNYPFFSPDGEWLGFGSMGQILKMSVHGGARLVLASATNFRGAAWSDDGNIYASADDYTILRIPGAGGTPQTVVPPQKNRRRLPWALPGGAGLLINELPPGVNTTLATGYNDGEIQLLVPKTGEIRTLVRGAFSPAYLPSGHLLYQNQNTLFAVRVDRATMQPQGSAVPLLDDVAASTPNRPYRQFDISRTGTLVYWSGQSVGRPRPLVWLDASGSWPLIPSPPGYIATPRFSPDGKRIAASVGGGLWVFDPERGVSTRLTTGGVAQYPVWTPDGKAIIFMSTAPGIGWVPADGSAPAQTLLEGAGNNPIPHSLSPDGRVLAFHQGMGSVGHRVIYTVDLDLSGGGVPKAGEPKKFVETDGAAADCIFSPDGRWIAYIAGPLGNYQTLVRPAPGSDGEGQVQISTVPGRFPMWSRTSKQIFYVTNDGHIMAVPYAIAGKTFVPGKPAIWTQQKIELNGVAFPIDLAPNGKSFAATLPANNGDSKENLHLNFVLNFMDEVKRKLP